MEYLINPGSKQDRASIELYTKSRKRIPNEQRKEVPREILLASKPMFSGDHPLAKLRSLTYTYNCVGMIFSSRRTHIDIENLAFILNEDGYQKLDRIEDIFIGDLVLYAYNGNLTHVGIVYSKVHSELIHNDTLFILSKWGSNGEYLHELADVPALLGIPTEYWTERKKYD